MRMFVANASRHIQNFQYRVPENPQVRQQNIPIGGQIQISGDINIKDVEAIIKQHEKYGLISVDEIASTTKLASLCYQLDKPIHPSKIEHLSNRNIGVLQDRGHEQRKNAAIVLATQLGAGMKEQGMDMESVEVKLTEDDGHLARDRRSKTGDDRMEETTVITPENKPRQEGSRRNRNRNR